MAGLIQSIPRLRANEKTMRDICVVFFRQKLKMLILGAAVLFSVIFYTFVTDEIYQSEGKLLVRIGRESVALDPTASLGDIVSIRESRESEINSILEIIRSRSIAESVVDAVGPQRILNPHDDTLSGEASLDAIARDATRVTRTEVKRASGGFRSLLAKFDLINAVSDRERAILSLMKNLKVEASNNSYLISVVYETASPYVAQQVLQNVIDAYLAKHIDANQTKGSYEFFVEQTDTVRKRLEETTEALTKQKNVARLSSLSDELRVATEHIGSIKTQLSVTESQRAASEARIEALTELLKSLPETKVTAKVTGIDRRPADELQIRLNDLKVELKELLVIYQDNDFRVKRVQSQIDDVNALLAKEEKTTSTTTTGANYVYDSLESDLLREQAVVSSIVAQRTSLVSELENAQSKLEVLNTQIALVENLQRERDILETSYQDYSRRLEEARTNRVLETEKISNISVVQAASLPEQPIHPKKLLLLALGCVLGGLLSTTSAFFFEFIDRSFREPADIERRLGLDALATINTIESKSVAPVISNVDTKLPQAELPEVLRAPIHALRDRLLLEHSPSGCVCLGLVSCNPGEGVTTISTALAIALAQDTDQRVLLIDANLNAPSVHARFQIGATPGIKELIAGATDFNRVLQRATRNLDIIAAGVENIANPSSAIADFLESNLDNLRKTYTHILVDLPSVRNESSSMRTAGILGMALLIIRAEHTRSDVAMRAKAMLETSHARLIGAVLNRRRYYVPEWVYRWL